jgi:hypothetical protein
MTDEWRVTLGTNPKSKQRTVNFPIAISRALTDAGYQTALIRLTNEGLLVVPGKEPKNNVELPEAWTT